MEFLLFWVVFVVLIGIWAHKWNRNAFGWAVLSFFISPLLGALFLLASGVDGNRCLACTKTMRKEAVVCGSCGRSIAEAAAIRNAAMAAASSA